MTIWTRKVKNLYQHTPIKMLRQFLPIPLTITIFLWDESKHTDKFALMLELMIKLVL